MSENKSTQSPPDWRGLCEELANHLQGRKDHECGWPGEDPEQDLIDRARAALAQPEPEVVGPSDEELREAFHAHSVVILPDESDDVAPIGLDVESARRFARAVLARFGRLAPAAAGERQAAPVPVAVSGWQPIDTAPKDGTEILASDYDAIEMVSWVAPRFEVGITGEWTNREGEAMYPAWWQPLPDHPPLPGGEVE